MKPDEMWVRNAWYVAAEAGEVRQSRPFARTLLEEPVVLYRQRNGAVVAMEDRCPHRYYPLSLGEVVGDNLRCGYHGLTIDGEGNCVRAPNQDGTPHCPLRTYPVEERFGLVWLWMGDPSRASADAIPGHLFQWNDDPEWVAPRRVSPH